MLPKLAAIVGVIAAGAYLLVRPSTPSYTPASRLEAPLSYTVPCSMQYDSVAGCAPPTVCSRNVVDDFVSEEEARVLLGIAERGMQGSKTAETGGPTILDITSGYRMDTELINLHKPGPDAVAFSAMEYKVYATVFDRIRNTIVEHYGLEHLGFTAPTFITRIVGKPSWEPAYVHDEYYHPHVDKNNTEHYDYSGLVYLSTYGEDFQGGKFQFLDGATNHTVEPRRGRFSFFSAGQENLHRVNKVTEGTRFVMSMWFTCSKDKTMDLHSVLAKAYKHSMAIQRQQDEE